MDLKDAKRAFPEFEVLEALPKSAQKAAFRARTGDGRIVCLKVFLPDANLARVEREVMAMREISHPNVCKIEQYELSASDKGFRHFLVEEFIEGQDLSELIGQRAPLPLIEARGMLSEIAEGLGALHHQNIVHRDLKPQNIRVRSNGSPVIIDFGLARFLDLESITATATGAALGTIPYFAPEQFVGSRHDIDQRTDLFALGVIAYQLIVGEHPFLTEDMTRDELEIIVMNPGNIDSSADFSSLPKKWRILISQLLKVARAERPANAGLVQKVLAAVEV